MLPDPKALLFRNYVQGAFNAAAEAFSSNPSANNWTDLKIAMWAWQGVHQMKEEISDVAHEHLMQIAEGAKGDRNFEEQ